jgi:uncharacterized protein with FMN-binding domain
MKKAVTVIVVVLAVIILIGAFGVYKFKMMAKEISGLKIENIDLSKVKDGEYTGKLKVFVVSSEVKVTVQNKKIIKIDIIKHMHGKGYGADKITEKIIEKQSLEVDAITGATGSSKVMLKAIENALKEGMK